MSSLKSAIIQAAVQEGYEDHAAVVQHAKRAARWKAAAKRWKRQADALSFISATFWVETGEKGRRND